MEILSEASLVAVEVNRVGALVRRQRQDLAHAARIAAFTTFSAPSILVFGHRPDCIQLPDVSGCSVDDIVHTVQTLFPIVFTSCTSPMK